MKKKEFMNELKDALDGSVSTQTYYDTIDYYEDYFKKQKDAGKTEEEICNTLGSARLIAKTIIDTEGQGASGRYYDSEDEGSEHITHRQLNMESRFGNAIRTIVFILIAALVIGIVLGVIWLGIKIVWYVVIPVAVILFVVNLIIHLWER